MSTKLVKSGVLVQTKSIRTPDNFAALLAEPRIKRLAKSIGAVTQIHAITVEKLGWDSYKLWAGHDRFAAVTLAGKQTIRADIRTGSEADFLLLQLAENSERRASADESIRAMESLRGGEGQPPGDVPPLSKAKARQKTADAKGIQAESMRKAEQRKRKKVAAPPPAEKDSSAGVSVAPSNGAPAAVADEAGTTPPPLTLDLLGVDDEGARAIMHLALSEQAAIDEADKHLRLAQTALARLSRAAVQQELKEQVRRVASMVRAERPAALCPWCKGLPSIPKCGPCDTFGYVKGEKRDRAPRDLTASLTPLVAIDGVFYPYAEVRDGKLPAKNGKPANRARGGIKVETTDGVTHDLAVELDDDEAY